MVYQRCSHPACYLLNTGSDGYALIGARQAGKSGDIVCPSQTVWKIPRVENRDAWAQSHATRLLRGCAAKLQLHASLVGNRRVIGHAVLRLRHVGWLDCRGTAACRWHASGQRLLECVGGTDTAAALVMVGVLLVGSGRPESCRQCARAVWAAGRRAVCRWPSYCTVARALDERLGPQRFTSASQSIIIMQN
jgi:hypothetical protein